MKGVSERAYRVRGMPRIIRRGTEKGKDGRWTWAVDRKLGVRIKRVKARTAKPCASKRCQRRTDGLILPNTEYAKVHDRVGRPMFIAGRSIYSPHDYHFDCLPEKYRPLVRFLQPK